MYTVHLAVELEALGINVISDFKMLFLECNNSRQYEEELVMGKTPFSKKHLYSWKVEKMKVVW